MANAITAVRLGLIPVFIYLMLFYPRFYLLSVVVLTTAALTDWLDGWVARSIGKVTDFGKVFDPLVDRLLVLAAVVMIYTKMKDLLPLWSLAIIIGREVLLVAGYRYLQVKNKKMTVTYFGKIATAVLLIAFILLLLGTQVLGLTLFYLGLLLYVMSAVDYIIKGVKKLKAA